MFRELSTGGSGDRVSPAHRAGTRRTGRRIEPAATPQRPPGRSRCRYAGLRDACGISRTPGRTPSTETHPASDRGKGTLPLAPSGAQAHCVRASKLFEILKLASLALRTLRVLELRSYGTSHSPSAPPPVAIPPRSSVPDFLTVRAVCSSLRCYLVSNRDDASEMEQDYCKVRVAQFAKNLRTRFCHQEDTGTPSNSPCATAPPPTTAPAFPSSTRISRRQSPAQNRKKCGFLGKKGV